MSGAFVKDDEEQWLQDIPPTMNALINYLSRENNGIRVYEKSERSDTRTGKQVHMMSNGLGYMVDNDNKWTVAD